MSTPVGDMRLDLRKIDPSNIASLTDDQLRALASQVVNVQAQDRKENQLLYYQPASERARLMHLSKARWLGIGGGNGACLPLHAPVLMADGTWKPLGQIERGDMIVAADPVTGETAKVPVLNTFRSGRKPVYRITFSDGGSFEATVEHQVPLYLGSGRMTSKGNPKMPEKRRLGDYIEAINRRGATNPSKRISAVSPGEIRTGVYQAQIDPWALGALLGDGGISQRGVKFFSNDPEVVSRMEFAVATSGGTMRKYAAPYEYGISCPQIARELKRLGLQGTNTYTKFIPEECFGWHRSKRLNLLAGLIDTDGGIHSFVSASHRLAQGVARLVRSLGGKATVSFRSTMCQNGPGSDVAAVYFRLNEPLPLALPRKQPPNQRGRAIDYRRRVCRSAELVGVFDCGDIEVDHPAHCYITGDYVIVSNSKTDTCLADMAALCTGIIPESVPEIAERFKGPINCRIVLQSLTTTLHPVVLPKLQWYKWSGLRPMGGEKGHWGWIPRLSLIDGDWERSWSEKLRVLRIICRDPEQPDRVLGESTIQFCSHDQDPQDMASGDFDIVLFDEPTKYAIWQENKARTMRVNGRMIMAMTWPDDPAIAVDWIFDELYEPGQPGPNKSPEHQWLELSTRENKNLDQRSVNINAANMDEATRKSRIEGQPLRFSNRIHPLFTDREDWWSFAAGRSIFPMENEIGQKVCPETGSVEIVQFTHVHDIEPSRIYPTVFILDPHPRKPHMFCWVQIDPADDYQVVLEGDLAGSPQEVAEMVRSVEESWGLYVTKRLMDPNMGRSPSTAGRRDLDWQTEFMEAGLSCDLASDSDVGRSRINEYLQPDRYTLKPRLTISTQCQMTVFQFKRYVWDDHKRSLEKDLKQVAKPKYDDYPTMIKYLMNDLPDFRSQMDGHHVIQRAGMQTGAYGPRRH